MRAIKFNAKDFLHARSNERGTSCCHESHRNSSLHLFEENIFQFEKFVPERITKMNSKMNLIYDNETDEIMSYKPIDERVVATRNGLRGSK